MNDKIVGVFIGIAIVLGASLLVGMTVAHTNGDNIDSASSGMMMHGMDHDENDDMSEHMENCPMMKGDKDHEDMHGMMEMMMGHSHMSVEDMDEDGDGLCDMCGMPIEECPMMK